MDYREVNGLDKSKDRIETCACQACLSLASFLRVVHNKHDLALPRQEQADTGSKHSTAQTNIQTARKMPFGKLVSRPYVDHCGPRGRSGSQYLILYLHELRGLMSQPL